LTSVRFSLDELTMIGIDFRSAPLALRERVAVADPMLPGFLAELRESCAEVFVLSTCNRTELYALGASAAELERALAAFHQLPREEFAWAVYAAQGERAFEHLMRVASGLHSMMLGEPQILTQLRTALDAARAAETLGPLLSRAGEAALRTGKRVRTDTGLGRGNSIPHAATAAVVEALGENLIGQRMVIAGAGQMAGHVARLLRSAGADDIVILNRTVRHAEALAHAIDARFAGLDALNTELPSARVVISAITLPDRYLIDSTVNAPEAALFIDLGVPRSIDPALVTAPLLDIDRLGATGPTPDARETDLAAIEHLIAEESAALALWVEEREVATTIASLREQSEAIRQSELQRALRRLGALNERERNIVEALSVALVGKLLHQPVTSLKSERGELALAAQRLFGLPSLDRSSGECS